MRTFWKTTLFFLGLMVSLFFGQPIQATEPGLSPLPADTPVVHLYLFWSQGCPHCHELLQYLPTLQAKYPQLAVQTYEVSSNSQNVDLLETVAAKLGVAVRGVPFTIIADRPFTGYLDDNTTGASFAEVIEQASTTASAVQTGAIIRQATRSAQESGESSNVSPLGPNKPARTTPPGSPKQIDLPIIGPVKVEQLSLPVLTVLIAGLDGFNPCAMWTLLFLITLLLGVKSTRRRWTLGVAFIATSAAVYFLFLSAWLNLFLFLGFVFWLRYLIGALAVGAGTYYLRDFWVYRSGACKIVGQNEKRQQVFAKLRTITERPSLWVALLGIMLLAVAVNLVELVCSAGLPAIYTQILSLADLPTWQYYAYLLLYILIFMLDDLFVFVTAMLTLRISGVEDKYARYSHLVGGILILLIGLLLIFKPEVLMFG